MPLSCNLAHRQGKGNPHSLLGIISIQPWQEEFLSESIFLYYFRPKEREVFLTNLAIYILLSLKLVLICKGSVGIENDGPC